MKNANKQRIHYHQRAPFWVARFDAMACPCELLIATPNLQHAQSTASIIAQEVWRIEAKYSRYTQQGIIAAINNAQGKAVELDEETLGLFNYAQQLFTLSEGLFDISSGVLKKLWDFRTLAEQTTQKKLPKQQEINALLPFIGLEKAQLKHNHLTLPKGMQLDFGGIGKEYAADKSLQLALSQTPQLPLLINLGGDIVASQSLAEHPWRIGICDYAMTKTDQPQMGYDQAVQTQAVQTQKAKHQKTRTQKKQLKATTHNAAALQNAPALQKSLTLQSGAITTSGIYERQWVINGKSYSHILNPKTGWPISHPPATVTVAAPTCMQAGMLSTLIMLQGQQAEAFAQQEDIKCWITR